MAHSRLGASSSHRWMNCPASAVLPQRKYTPSVYAAEGTVAHEIAERTIRAFQAQKLIKLTSFIGQKFSQDGFDFIVDSDMVEYVRVYLTHLVDTAKSLINVKVEKRFNLDWLFPGMFGTCDAHAFVDRTLHVMDLKYGAGTPVYAKENTQLMYYALGILGKEGFKKVDNIVLHIIQPRHDTGITTWEISDIDLFSFAYSQLLPAAKRTKENNPVTVSGDWCTWCPCMGDCPQITNDMVAVFEKDVNTSIEAIDLPPVNLLSVEQKAKLLSIREVFTSYLDAVYESTYTDALEGKLINGYKLVSKRSGNRRWRSEELAINAFKGYGDEVYEDRKLKSPSKIEKIVGSELVSSLVYRPETGLELVPETDKREAVNPVDTMAGIFENV